MGWRRHKSHREETLAVKKALNEAGIHPESVRHDRGTAWSWLVINLGPNPSGLEHVKYGDGWFCVPDCPACRKNQEIRRKVIRIVQEVTGRHGEYNGEIQVLMQ